MNTIKNFLSFEEKKSKSQEQNSQTLFESQELIFQKISQVLSHSSQSTNVGDIEDTLQGLGNVHSANGVNLEEASTFPQYNLRTRRIKKHSQRQTPDVSVSHRPKNKTKKKEFKVDSCSPNNTENTEMGHSQESVSMLQECYDRTSFVNEFPEFTETCMKPQPAVINIYSDEECDSKQVEEGCATAGVDKSTQTDYRGFHDEPSQSKELEMAKHANFISSVVKLKAILASRKSVSDKKLRDILNKDFGEGTSKDGGGESNVPRETIGYLFRSSDTENVFHETVGILLRYLEDVLRENLSRMVYFWKNSICEVVVKMVNEATDSEVKVRKMVEAFLFNLITSILKNEEKLKNLMLESKAMFVVSFCQSAYLSYIAIDFIIRQLQIIKTVSFTAECTSAADKLPLTRLIKNSYLLLRILESLLKSFKAKAADGKIGDVVVEKPEANNFNVLEMWKRHWNRDEVQEVKGKGHEWEKAVSKWCEELGRISLHCLDHIPVLLMVTERCGELSKEILVSHHPVVREYGQSVTSAAEKSDVESEMEMDL